MLLGLNHITLAVSDLEQSLKFYIEVLGFKGHVKWNDGAYLSLGDLWFCLSSDKPCPKDDYTHLAFDISSSDFEPFCKRLACHAVTQWKVNKSEGQSRYILDPDGHKLEIHVGNLSSRLEAIKSKPYAGLVWLST
ncbi:MULTISPECIES: fosfomycin resistance glutathione transferase [unclassified Agarivorans]|uniref:fosfomycin resistance glutathione transferase n=1 Tax=unclassified Agarivorans TaxID=2636026 RepID=UPI003D7C5F8F